jgi:hypothetical protein
LEKFVSPTEERAWFIGLIEGEGSFYVEAGRKSAKPTGVFSLAMSDQDVIWRARYFLAKWYDVYLNVTTEEGRSEHHKRMFRIRTSRMASVDTIISFSYPHLSEKKQSDCDRVLKSFADRSRRVK